MNFMTLSSKGQVTLPIEQRRKLGLNPHDRLISECVGNTIIIRRARSFFEYEGFIEKSLPIEEEQRLMEEAVAREVLGLDE